MDLTTMTVQEIHGAMADAIRRARGPGRLRAKDRACRECQRLFEELRARNYRHELLTPAGVFYEQCLEESRQRAAEKASA